jgi:hypothetical protein
MHRQESQFSISKKNPKGSVNFPALGGRCRPPWASSKASPSHSIGHPRHLRPICFCQISRVCRINIFVQRYEQRLTFTNSDHHHHFTIPLQWVMVVVPCSNDPVTRLSRMQRIHSSAPSNCYPPITSPDFSTLFRGMVISSALSSTSCGSPLLK